MKKALVSIFVKDRYHHTRLCVDWLLKSKQCEDIALSFVAFDDNSEDKEMLQYVRSTGISIYTTKLASQFPNPSRRIGLMRQIAVENFFRGDFDYLLLLDSDIIVTRNTIQEAVKDYDSLKEHRIAGYTLYALGHIVNCDLQIANKIFKKATLTGDATMLFSRESLLQVGNNFSSAFGGFADHQIKAIYDQGFSYFTRVDPYYSVQHLGFGEKASLCYQEEYQPFWTYRPYWNHTTRSIIQVPGFDMTFYCQCVKDVGGLLAPKKYLETKGVDSRF